MCIIHMGIIHIKIPKAADVKGNSSITAIEKKVFIFKTQIFFFFLTHEEILLFGQITSTYNREILFTFMNSGTPKFVLKS